jgi:hypothetical protein
MNAQASGSDAQLHFDLVYRNAMTGDHPIASADSMLAQADEGIILKGEYGANLDGAAVPSACGDFLVLKVKFVSGSSSLLEFRSSMAIP